MYPPLKAFVINLPDRKDRLEDFKENFKGWNLDLEIIPGIKNAEGWKGCALSHRKAVEKAKADGLKWVLVLEDDCKPVEPTADRFNALLPILWKRQNEWDIFMGGPTATDHKEMSLIQREPPLLKMNGYAIHFIIINGKIFDSILNGINKLSPPVVDIYYREKFIMWATYPSIAVQNPSYSNIQRGKMNYTTMFKNTESKIKNILNGKITSNKGGRRLNYNRTRRLNRKRNKKKQHGAGESIGFIITRCVKKKEHNALYKECYNAIRRFYPDLKIIIIDDNSDKEILEEHPMTNYEIIQSEYPAAGEFLPYYYLITKKLFDKAIIIQDSMILNSKIPYEEVNDYKFFYEFNAEADIGNVDKNIIGLLNNTKVPNELMELYKSKKWVGCFGTTMVMTYDFAIEHESKLGITKWASIINNRNIRMALERAMAIACIYLKGGRDSYNLFGKYDDMQTFKEGLVNKYNIHMYLENPSRIKDKIIKIWNAR